MATKVLILDNGAATQKAGYTSQTEPRIIPNCITKAKSERQRSFTGDQIDDCKDVSGLFYILPFQKGYLVNWEVEKQVWDYTFGRDVFKVDFAETCLVVTEPYFNFTSIQENMTEILFEEYQFNSLLRINHMFKEVLSKFLKPDVIKSCSSLMDVKYDDKCNQKNDDDLVIAGTLSAHKYHQENKDELCCLVIDSGFSFTHIIPCIKGKKLKNAIRRINVGGKVLTNHLKDIISYRQLHVMDETYVMNQVKEDVCYISTDFWEDMKLARKRQDNSIVRDYVLPDYTIIKRGYVRPLEETTGKSRESEQIIRMNNERFMVPEILFHPSDVGIKEMGISEAIIHSIDATPDEVQPHLYKNILLTGGSCCFSGFKERVFDDVRSLAPEIFDVKVSLAESPVINAWQGGVVLSKDPEFGKLIISKKQYEEHGMTFCLEKFDV